MKTDRDALRAEMNQVRKSVSVWFEGEPGRDDISISQFEDELAAACGKEDSEERLNWVSMSILPLVNFYDMSAARRIIADDYQAAITELAKAHAYRAAFVDAEIARQKYHGMLHQHYPHGLNILAHTCVLSIIFSDENHRDSSLAMLRGLEENGMFEDYDIDMPYFDFATGLASFSDGKGAEPNYPTRYGALIRAWDDPNALSDVALELLDHHLDAVLVRPGFDREHESNFPEYIYKAAFNTDGLALLPLEILSAWVTRRKFGLEIPSIDHPLLPEPLVSAALSAAQVSAPDAMLKMLAASIETASG
jgi:hypothetical protein